MATISVGTLRDRQSVVHQSGLILSTLAILVDVKVEIGMKLYETAKVAIITRLASNWPSQIKHDSYA